MRSRAYLIWMVLPVLPFCLSFVTLQVLAPEGVTLLSSQIEPESFHTDGLALRFIGGLMIYAAVAFFHVCFCLGVIGSSALSILRLPPRARGRSLAVLGVVLLILGSVSLLAQTDLLVGALNLTYRTACDFVRLSGAAPHLMPESCTAGPLSLFAWMALLPYAMGLIAATFTGALTATAYDAVEGEADLVAGAARADEAFRATSIILATSAATMVVFYRLPVPLIAEEALREQVVGFGQGMSLFWGVAFTLALGAIFGPSALLMRRLVAAERDAPQADALRDSLAARSTARQMRDALTMLAPLLVGAAGPVAEMLAGLLG